MDDKATVTKLEHLQLANLGFCSYAHTGSSHYNIRYNTICMQNKCLDI